MMAHRDFCKKDGGVMREERKIYSKESGLYSVRRGEMGRPRTLSFPKKRNKETISAFQVFALQMNILSCEDIRGGFVTRERRDWKIWRRNNDDEPNTMIMILAP
jgi:hypothetical protein